MSKKEKKEIDENEEVKGIVDLDDIDDSSAYEENEDDISEDEIDRDVDELMSQVNKGSLDSVALFLSEVGSIPLLTEKEEQGFGQAIVAGREAKTMLEEDEGISADDRKALRTLIGKGEEARDSLVNHNLRLVVFIAKNYRNRGVDFADLIEAGAEGLMRAATRFDYTKGNKFSTYATWWIRQACVRYIDDNGRTIRLPVHLNENIAKVKRAESDLMKENGGEPSVEEIAERASLKVSDVKKVYEVLSQGTTSLNTVISNSEKSESSGEPDSTLEMFLEDTSVPDFTDIAGDEDRDDVIERMIADLTDEDVTILRCRLGIGMKAPMTQEETGVVVGKEKGVGQVSREAIRTKENRAAERCYKNLK